MIASPKILLIRWRSSYFMWRKFWAILATYNRCGELKRLIRWASEKKLPGPVRLYQSRMAHEENRLLQYIIRYSRLTTWAQCLHILSRLIFPAPRYLAKGSAAFYRYGNVEKLKSSHLVYRA